MRQSRPGPAALECAIDVWGKRGPVTSGRRCRNAAAHRPGRRARGREAARQGQRVLIVVGGGALDASPEVTLLSDLLQAPVLAYRRGRGVLDGRDPFSVTLPLGRELWGEADAVLASARGCSCPIAPWGVDKNLQIVRVDTDREEPARQRRAEGRADRRRRAGAAAS